VGRPRAGEDPGGLGALKLEHHARRPAPGNDVSHPAISIRETVILSKAKDLQFVLYQRLRKTADGLGLVVVHVEHGVELGNLEKIVNLFGKVQELELSTLV